MPAAPSNRILAALAPSERNRLRPHLEFIDTELKQVLFNVDVPIEYVYFPENIVVSVLGVMPDGTAVEVATVGREGVVGLPVFLGAEKMSAQALVQVTGKSFRIRAETFREQLQRLPRLRELLNRYTQALFTLIAQGSACNRLHSVEERCARWLLQTRDRVGRSTFPLTQQFLSQMLGVRRAGVSEAASVLQAEGLLRYQRGVITILDEDGLMAAACECYAIVQSEFDRLLEDRQSHNPLSGVAPRLEKEGRSKLRDGSPRPRRKRRARR